MNKKIYSAPIIDVVELQGNIAIAAGSGNIVDDSGTDGPNIHINSGTMDNVDNNNKFDSNAYFKVWDDEK